MERKRSDFEFEIALSFAGEQREYVEEFASELKALGVKVFYDNFEQVNLWGKDLYQYLNDIYKNKCLFTIVFISEDYAIKRWTKHELKSVQARAFNENTEYILPVKFDNTELKGFNETTGYLSIKNLSPKQLADLTEQKLDQFGSRDESKDFEKVEIADYKKLNFIQRIDPEELIGRKEDLKKLHQLLTEKRKVVLVNGMGGIGKTTLAAAYTFQYYDYYKKLVWITQSQDDITNDFIQNEQLIQSLKIDKEGKQADQLFAEMLHLLSNIPERPKLLVIDNAFEGLEAHLDKLPSQPEWEVLVTSREAIEGLYPMPLDFLKEEEAIALFQKYCSYISDFEEIKALVNAVELHTLSIEILARTAQKQKTKPTALKQALEKDLRANVKTAHSKKNKIERITTYLSTIFDLSTLSEDETWLLKNFCALPPEFHEYDLLLRLIGPEASGRSDIFAETLENLVSKGWLLKTADTESYRMHRVIFETGIRKMEIKAEDLEPLVDNLADLLSLDHTKENPIDKFIWVPFGQSCLGIEAIGSSKEKARLQCHTGLRLKNMGDYHGAKSLMEKAMFADEKNFGKGHPTTAIDYSNLATVLQDLGDYPRAKTLLEKAMISDEKNFGEEHPTTAISYSNLAMVLQDLGDYPGAKTLLEKVMISDEKNFGKDHPSTAVTYSNLAMVLKAMGDYPTAKTLLEKALISDEKNFGKDHPSTAVTYSNLAMVLKAMGDYQGAKTLLEKAMFSAEKNFGQEHPTTAVRYSNLALVLEAIGEYKEALELVEKALGVFLTALPEGHPTIETVRGNLEGIQQKARKAGYGG